MEENTKNTFYIVKYRCCNCGSKGIMEIDKGTSTKSFFENQPCPYCGVKDLVSEGKQINNFYNLE